MNKNNFDTVAVIVPVYNSKKTLKTCVNSIQNQTYDNLKIILVDDGSTDDSGLLCDKMAKADNRIFVIHQKNVGASKARRNGVQFASHKNLKYVIMCDSDDIMPKNAIEKLFGAIKHFDADCAVGNMCAMWKGLKFSPSKRSCFEIEEPKCYNTDAIITNLYPSCFGEVNYPVSWCAKIYKTNILTKVMDYSSVVKFMGEDLEMTLRLLPLVDKLVIMPDVVYHYRMGGGTSRYTNELFEDNCALFNLKYDFLKMYPLPKYSELFLNKEFLNNFCLYISRCISCKKYTKYEVLHIIHEASEKNEVIKCVEYFRINKISNEIADLIYNKKFDDIYNIYKEKSEKINLKGFIKKLMLKM